MSDSVQRRSILGAGLTVLAGLCGAAIAYYLYATELTGVTGTPGALLVLAACLAVAAGGLLMMVSAAAAWRWLTVAGILGTALAAFFLHGWWIIAAMFAALVGVVVDRLSPARTTEGAVA